MQSTVFETLIGALVVLVVAGVLYLAYAATGGSGINGYDLKAAFTSADGVTTGTDVLLHGIKIGNVSSMELDPNTYQAVLHLTIRNNVKIPDDSSVKITSAGLLGGDYLSVTPGGSDTMLAAGSTITNTQGSIDLMGLIGHVIYGNANSK
jgi:phospholipid/cholesterol/gamma-HCH transport system substrate-binding protein